MKKSCIEMYPINRESYSIGHFETHPPFGFLFFPEKCSFVCFCGRNCLVVLDRFLPSQMVESMIFSLTARGFFCKKKQQKSCQNELRKAEIGFSTGWCKIKFLNFPVIISIKCSSIYSILVSKIVLMSVSFCLTLCWMHFNRPQLSW